MKKLGKNGHAQIRIRAVAPRLPQRDPTLAGDVDLTQIVRRGITRGTQHDIHIELGAVIGHQRTGAQRPRRARHDLDVRLRQRLQIVRRENQTLAAERMIRSELAAQVFIGHRRFQDAQSDAPELLCLV